MKLLTKKDMDDMFGANARKPIGSCFKTKDEHYYMQREKDVLHVCKNIINNVHNSILSEKIIYNDDDYDYNDYEFIPITLDEFKDELKKVFWDLEIDDYLD